LLDLARSTPGFMPDDEGLALHAAALDAARHGPQEGRTVGGGPLGGAS
jgi:hypothetical protein